MRKVVLLVSLAIVIVCGALPLLSLSRAAAAPHAAPHLEPLRTQLARKINGCAGQNAVSVLDLQTGELISINGTRPQLAACTIKIPVLMAVAQDIEAGRYTADEVASLVRAAMGPSATPPARALIERVGGGNVGAGVRRVNALMRDAGMRDSILTHPLGYSWEEYGYAASHGISDNLLTTDDLVRLLGKLYRDEVLSPTATDYTLWSMTLAPDWMNRSFSSGQPAGVRRYHKIGQLYAPLNTWNDAGIVVFERDGREYAYAVAYLGSWGASWQDAYAHAMDVTATVWKHFSNAPLPARQPVRQRLTSIAAASASSTLAPETVNGNIIAYDARNVLDRNVSTAWVEGAPGDGIGQALTLSFSQPVTIDTIGVNVGLDRDNPIFAANNRVRRAHVVFADGSTQPLVFEDRRGIQQRAIKPVTTTSLRLVIDEVFSGTTYDDTAISSVEVWGLPPR